MNRYESPHNFCDLPAYRSTRRTRGLRKNWNDGTNLMNDGFARHYFERRSKTR